MIIQADKIITRLDRTPLVAGAVVIRYGRIVAVGKATVMMRKYRNHRIVRLERAVVMPGLVNVHTHLELPYLLDDIRALNYTDWVLNLLKKKKLLTRHDYKAAVNRNITSLIRSGTTTVAEISTHGISPSVLRKSGLRAVIYQEMISMEQACRRMVFPRRLFPPSSLISFGLSPHSPHTVSEPALQIIRSYADRKHLDMCMHVAETKEETRLLQQKKSTLEELYAAVGWDISMAPKDRSSFSYLHRIGVLGPAFLAVHAVQADDQDISIVKRSGASVAHCPLSNSALQVGKMALEKFLRAGIPVGLGTDSLASVSSLNLWDEMRYALRIHKTCGVTPADIFHVSTIGGAMALGMDREIGSLETGKKADLISVSLPRKDTGDLFSDLLRETKTCTMNMVNGHFVYGEEAGRMI